MALDATVAEALDLIRAHNIRHLPVVEGARLAGIVSDRDLRMALDPEEPASSHAAVSEIMTSPAVLADPDMPIEGAAALLAEHRIGCLPVLEGGELVGILTEADVLRAFVELLSGREKQTRLELLAPDRPGELARVVRLIGIDHHVNITGVVVPPTQGDQALVVVHLECDDAAAIVEDLRRLGYEAGSPTLPARPS